MSCGLHDVARLEARSVPTAFLVTDAFAGAVADQLPLLGMTGYAPVWVSHPVAALAEEEVAAKAEAAIDDVAGVLIGNPMAASPRESAAAPHAAGDCGEVGCAVDLVERLR